MKKIIFWLSAAVLVWSMSFGAYASDVAPEQAPSILPEQAEALDVDAVTDSLSGSAAEIMDGESIEEGVDAGGVLERMISYVSDSISQIIKESILNGGALVFTAVLCSAVSGVIKTKGLGDLDYMTLVGVIAVSALSFGGVRSFVNIASDALTQMDDFSRMLLPALTAAAAAGGAVTSSAAKYAAVTLFMNIMISVITYVILPLTYAYTAASLAAAAFGGDGLRGAAAVIKWTTVTVLTATVLIFTVYITVSGVVSGTADAAASRLTKTVLSTALPVVGSIISDAAGTVLTGAAALKNAVGVFGLLAVLAICLSPFLRLGINYLIYKAAALLASAVADKNISSAISSVSTAAGIALGATGACALMLFFGIISVIKAVTF